MATVPAPHNVSESVRTFERPALHFTPGQFWMNDPNGLVFVDGVYHLYFQCNPYGMDHANVSWGHATSPDLVEWTEHSIAIAADRTEHVYSGSVVVDHMNSSGLGDGARPPMVALYTSASPPGSSAAGRQAQSVAVSVDGGYNWSKYAGNPVLDRNSSDFRDPKVFRYDDGHRSYWVMVAVEARDRQVVLYSSNNLLDWEYLSSFGPANATGGVWECPDLFELSIDGDEATTRWVLTVNILPGGPAGGSAGQYFVGTFDGKSFVCDLPTDPGVPAGDDRLDALDWLDWGRDYYAAVSFDNTPGRRVMIGWMCNWDYASELPTRPWHSSMTIPRQLGLHTIGGRIRLVQTPVESLGSKGLSIVDVRDRTVHSGVSLSHRVEAGPLRIDLSATGSWTLTLMGGDDAVALVFDADSAELRLDRRAASPGLPPSFPSIESVRLDWLTDTFELQIYVDRWSVEVFADRGSATITDLMFPASAIDCIDFSARDECKVHTLKISDLGPAGPKPH
ncbi:MAG: glycoside hydrolase family 32 protein [Rhodococcus sp. (in: high G+C Gram-positive bacteria)]